MIIGTAGHIDHGKTTLVKALTGVDLDSLPEEKDRGITIALGFAPLTLDDGRIAGIVDVPGHERLVRTMVAGASGLDAVLLCVSAVEGVMPQTREHLDILGILGVESGVLVVTMADLVDAELIDLAVEEIRDSVRGTFLESAPTIAVSSVTGAGLPELRTLLTGLRGRARDDRGPFRLPVDRSFPRKGFGTVVTGTAWTGTIADGAEVEILSSDAGAPRRARLRGVQVHGQKVDRARAGSRTALNVGGVDVAQVPRGSWLVTPGSVRPAQVVDIAFRLVAGMDGMLAPDGDAGAGERERRSVVVLHGTAEVEATLLPLAEGYAQLRLASPVAALPGDRLVVRQPSPARTIGGGRVLDPWFAQSRRPRALAGLAALAALASGDERAWLDRAGTSGLDRALATQLGVAGTWIGDRLYGPAQAQAMHDALLEAVAQLHQIHPLAMTVNRKEARRGLLRELDEPAFAALVDHVLASGDLVASGGVRLRHWVVAPTPDQQAWLVAALSALGSAGWQGLPELPPHADGAALAKLLEEQGELVRIDGHNYAASALTSLGGAVTAWFDSHETLDPAGFKEISGHTRRTAIPLLEWLDQIQVTRRRGDVRVRGSGAKTRA